MNVRNRQRQQSGFSLLEVLIAVTIIALMAGVAAVSLFPNLLEAKRDRAMLDIKNAEQAIKLFRMKEGRLPRESEWPTFLLEGSESRKEPYLDLGGADEFVDPWKTPYVYRKVGDGYEILSYGADGQPGGEGEEADISSKGDKKAN